VKINRNTAFDHNNSRVEISILKKIREGIADDDYSSVLRYYKDRVVKMKESFYFRNHYCMVFELLDKNLYSDMKEKNF
jgi:dual specificity tyrosine-phosphorylation-regulated kinase 2/3/4